MLELRQEVSRELSWYDIWKIVSKKKMVSIGLVILVVSLTGIISSTMPKIYRGEVLLNVLQYEVKPGKGMATEIVEAKEIVAMIGNSDQEMLALMLPTTHNSVTDVNFNVVRDSKDKIIVTVDAKTIETINKAVEEIVNYINNFEIIKLIVKEEKEKMLKRSTELSHIIDTSFDLSNTYRILLKEGKLFPVGFNPVELNQRISEIKLEKLATDQKIQRLSRGGVQIARQTFIRNKPVKPRILLNMVLSLAICLIFAIFVFVWLGHRDNIKELK